MKRLNSLSIIFFITGMMISGIANAQWTLQTNPIGTSNGNGLGKIQFVSATDGWINACKSGNLLHTTTKGNTWSIVMPFSTDVVGSLSDPAVNMSWSDATHGWVLKTLAGVCDTSFDAINSNGALLYSTNDGGGTWSKHAFPTTVSTTTYATSDLTGTWQIHILTTNDSGSSSESSWQYGTITIDASGSGSYSFIDNNGATDSGIAPLSISSCGIISVSGDADFKGFMSNDKQSAIITMNGHNGRSIMTLQKVNSTTSYATGDLQGTWQLHQVVASKTSGNDQNASWTHGTITFDGSGGGSGTFIRPGGTDNQNITVSVSPDGFVTMNGTDMNGYISADKQSLIFTMTDNGGYMLFSMQKVNTASTYTSADLSGKWQMHSLTTSQPGNSSLGGWTRGVLSESIMGSSVSNLVENGVSQNQQDVSFSISSTGEITAPGKDLHGYMSADKQTIYFTKTQNGSSVNGYLLMVLQRDNTTSGDLGLEVQFTDNNNGWASVFNVYTGGAQLFRSANGGTNWNPFPISMLGFFHFVDASNGWMVGSSSSVDNINTIYHTTDGGSTWTPQFTQTLYNGANVSFNAIYFSDLNHGWAVGNAGEVIKTTDGGTTWTWVTNTGMTTSSASRAVYFLDANTGWISSGVESTEGVGTQFVLATKDGGTTWSALSTPVTNSIFSLAFVDANHGWITSDKGQIARLSQNSINIAAGGLSAALTADQKSTVTGLAITGTMDARDFKSLRDEMPLLSYIDLSGVSVVAYSGTGGTYDNNITYINYPANTIPQRAFYNVSTLAGKTSLISFVFPAATTAIDSYAFCRSGLTSINIPSTINTIGFDSFYSNINLASVSIPSSVNIIDKWAFAYCSNLKNINIPSSVSTIGYAAFYNCGLNSISLPDGLTTIDKYAFQKCVSLNNITLPKTLAYVGYCAFAFTTNLNSFNIPSDNPNFSVNDGVLYNKAGTHLVAYPNTHSSMFNIPTGVAVIDTAAFEGAIYLNNITIPPTVTKLSKEAFYYCTNLQSVTIPASVTEIQGSVFYSCTNLNSIHAKATTPVDLTASINNNVFYNVSKSSCTLYVPAGSKTLYQGAVQWQDFTNIVEEITYTVKVPVGTNACFIAGDMNGWSFTPMTMLDATHYTITIPSSTSYGYKYCSGPSWAFQELDASGNSISNRTYSANDIVARWQHVFDPANPPSSMTYSVTVPSGTNACYIAGDMTNWAFTSMTKLDDIHYTISLPSSSDFNYKYCSGASWDYVEVKADGNDLPGNRTYAASDEVARWKAIPTGMNTLDADKLSLYPNPATDGFYIDTKYNSTAVSIYDLSGTLVLAKSVTGKTYIDITALPQGIYIVKINTENGVAEKKLVKQ